jgi:hypothetical protein
MSTPAVQRIGIQKNPAGNMAPLLAENFLMSNVSAKIAKFINFTMIPDDKFSCPRPGKPRRIAKEKATLSSFHQSEGG